MPLQFPGERDDMRLRRLRRIGWLLVAGMLITGCAASDTMVFEPLQANQKSYSSFEFSVVPHVTEDISEVQKRVTERVVAATKKLNVFKTVSVGAPRDSVHGTLFAKATVTHVRKVGEAARVFLGVFAGQAAITCKLVFVDGGTGQVVGSYNIVGESGGSGLSGGTGEASRKIAEAINRLIRDSFAPKQTTKSHRPAW